MDADQHTQRHAIVVGGTGMLRDVSLALARDGWFVSVTARPGPRLDALAAESSCIKPVACDWRDAVGWRQALQQATAGMPASLVVCWMHSTASDGPLILADVVGRRVAPPRFFLIYGSEADSRLAVKRRWRHELAQRGDIYGRTIVLGSHPSTRRSLTDAEIAEGVLRAIATDEFETIVGDQLAG